MAKLNAWQVNKNASVQVYHRNNRMKKWVAHHGSPRDVDVLALYARSKNDA